MAGMLGLGSASFEGHHAKTEPTLNPWEIQKLMGLGINLGNVLETPFEGKWAGSPTDQHFEMFHDAGFANVRIPVSWGNHMQFEEPFTLDKKFLARVDELVMPSLSHGMVTVITAHHEWWIDDAQKHRASSDIFEWEYKKLPRFEALWRQIATYFRHHRQLLIFGIINEPHALEIKHLNEVHRRALIAIRETNPSRIVTISGLDFANPRWLLENQGALWIPRDPQVMLEIHVTEPHAFAGSNPSISAWGSAEDRAKLLEWVSGVELYGRRNNLPVYCAEFGCTNEQVVHRDEDHYRPGHPRYDWLEANWQAMRSHGFAASVWDDGDRFSIYSRENGQWDQAMLAALSRSLPGLKGIDFKRYGGGLGGDSVDPTTDLQRRIESCFQRLSIHLDDVEKLPGIEEHEYISHQFVPPDEQGYDSDSKFGSDAGHAPPRRRRSQLVANSRGNGDRRGSNADSVSDNGRRGSRGGYNGASRQAPKANTDRRRSNRSSIFSMATSSM